ncbi:Pap fimbrial major pilin protein precursor [Providencia rustigianii]|uniref:Fimbrial protein n=2 Tax=Providencia rustigianii TaxID=158850 RepID=D1P6Y3_9GAMM|nr:MULTISPECIES: fimbrial protein [Providencia]EFB70830.1 fimbrial protein [Providencia rustigianii DSM 4541]MTC56212.1 fimbrial protein [Providencia rustigianii]MTC59762.1 fimbrial protein [Providencia rustigianii]SPY76405.1 Pap fimbrial major pilin protein precursor [Providencia rustigianii]SUC25610.1 Pap fimbrial major pilin protein precursor [Providencia rustigianii]
MKLNTLALATIMAASVTSFGVMAENTGTINFIGTVVTSPCNIGQSSLKQTVDFGQLSRRGLENGRSAEVDFNIEFTGCDFSDFTKDDAGTPAVVKSMELVFTGQNYADATNTLLSTSPGNLNNVGIAIDGFEFGKAKDILSRIINKKGDNTLSFKALAKAIDTTKDVTEGKFSAITNFRITYQ